MTSSVTRDPLIELPCKLFSFLFPQFSPKTSLFFYLLWVPTESYEFYTSFCLKCASGNGGEIQFSEPLTFQHLYKSNKQNRVELQRGAHFMES